MTTKKKSAYKERNIIDLAGAWSHISDEEIEKMKKVIEKINKQNSFNLQNH